MKSYRYSLFWLLLVVVPMAAVTSLGIRTVLLLNGTIRPPRPMFCNHFDMQHEFQIFPDWEPSYFLFDERNITGWTDFEDNAIVLVLPVGRRTVSVFSLQPGVEQSEIELGNDGPVARFSRQKNTLIVVLPDATVRTFSLRDHVAEDFQNANEFQNNQACLDLLAAAEKCLREESKEEYRQLRTDSRQAFERKAP